MYLNNPWKIPKRIRVKQLTLRQQIAKERAELQNMAKPFYSKPGKVQYLKQLEKTDGFHQDLNKMKGWLTADPGLVKQDSIFKPNKEFMRTKKSDLSFGGKL
jgi:hypothetical protein